MDFTQSIPLIVAIACLQIPGFGIGYDGQLIFKCSEDMGFFMQKTKEGKNPCVIFGRNSFYSIPKKFRPLKGRTTIVVSKDWLEIMAENPGVYAFETFEKALAWAKTYHDMIYICGGQEIYRAALPYCKFLYLTHIEGSHEADRFFPAYEDQFGLVKTIKTGFCDDKETPYTISLYEAKAA
jgi:dihydrofolate reductase